MKRENGGGSRYGKKIEVSESIDLMNMNDFSLSITVYWVTGYETRKQNGPAKIVGRCSTKLPK